MSYEMNRRTWLSSIVGASVACSGFACSGFAPPMRSAPVSRILWCLPNCYGITVKVIAIPVDWCREIPGVGWCVDPPNGAVGTAIIPADQVVLA
jgi:hypothetical protein